MKAVILAGGKGTRLAEETLMKPKPMVEIGGMPVLWHIMKIYSSYGIYDFVICTGYKGSLIKDYFIQYVLRQSDITVDMVQNSVTVQRSFSEPWRVTLVDTGLETMTAGRLKRVEEHVQGETFCFTYGDGLSDVNIGKLIDFHRSQGTLATVTATHHYSRFGVIYTGGQKVLRFVEKPVHDGSWMNSGFFVLEPGVFDLIDGDETVFEKEPLARLIQMGELSCYLHRGFFQGMDSLRDRLILEDLWKAGNPPWKSWEEETKSAGAEIGL